MLGHGCSGPLHYIPIDLHASVFQTEVLAINRCALYLLGRKPKRKHFTIHSDSQAAILALADPMTKSRLVEECKTALNQLGSLNTVILTWIPGHAGLEGNEAADKLARKGSSSPCFGPYPTLPISWSSGKSHIRQLLNSLNVEYWQSRIGHRQSKLLINPKLHTNITLFNRKLTKSLIGFLTGHYPTNHYLHKIGKWNNPNCRLCGYRDETTLHLLLECPAIARIRLNLLGIPFPDAAVIRNTELTTLTKLTVSIEAKLTNNQNTCGIL